jgi:hypothetical protein
MALFVEFEWDAIWSITYVSYFFERNQAEFTKAYWADRDQVEIEHLQYQDVPD